jgi:hypothetical protein
MQGCTQEQVNHFISREFVVIHDCFDEAPADWMLKVFGKE